MTNDAESGELAARLARFPRAGRVAWIGRSPARRAAIEAVTEVELAVGHGLVGDHHAAGGGKRQVTLLQAEHLPVVAALAGRDAVDPALLRRNLVVEGINLYALRDRRFTVGGALLEGTGTCPPCARMDENLGPGGFQAMRGHGGITAIVVEGGDVRVGDPVAAVADPAAAAGADG